MVPAEVVTFRFAFGGGLISRVAESGFRFAVEDMVCIIEIPRGSVLSAMTMFCSRICDLMVKGAIDVGASQKGSAIVC